VSGGTKRAIAGVLALVQLWLAMCAPAFAQDPGPTLLGMTAQEVAESARRAPTPERSWLGELGSGLWEGIRDALPNLVRQWRENPLLTTALILGGFGAAVLAPQIALLAGAGFFGYGLWTAGGDPRRTGQVLGETAFWGVAGGAVARGVQALRGAGAAAGPRPAPVAAPAPEPLAAHLMQPVRPGQTHDLVTGLKIQPGQTRHGQLFDWERGRPLVQPAERGLDAKFMRPHRIQFTTARMRTHMAETPHVGDAWATGNVDPHALLATRWAGVNGPGRWTPGRHFNCMLCAFAGDRTMGGQPMLAGVENRYLSPAMRTYHPTEGTETAAVARALGREYKSFASADAVAQEIVKHGDGARGIISALNPGGGGHAFNVVAWKGQAYFLDFQTGQPARVDRFSNWTMLRTYP
jgi:hypothetical protein